MKTHPPVPLTWKWIRPPGNELAILRINGVAYAVLENWASPGDGEPVALAGWRVFNARNGAKYDIGLETWGFSCTCPDSVYRPNRDGGCKHQRAFAEATETTR